MRHLIYNFRYSVVPRDSLLLTVTLYSSVRTTIFIAIQDIQSILLLLLLLLLLFEFLTPQLSAGKHSPILGFNNQQE
jgi:hypothetical protein